MNDNIPFGHGKLITSAISGIDAEGSQCSGVAIWPSDKPMPVGPTGKTLDEMGDPNLVISFSTLESLEIFQKQLNCAREILKIILGNHE